MPNITNEERQNAVDIDLNTVRNALAKNSQEGDYATCAEALGLAKTDVWKYMTGKRNIDTPLGRRILNAFAAVRERRAIEEKRAALIAKADSLS
jgi:hypothetical protein